MKKGWLVNDRLTCIQGTKTIWHNLLDWLPNLQDKTFGGTEFGDLNEVLYQESLKEGLPDYLIRNGTFFGPLDINPKTISLIQDSYTNSLRTLQLQVAEQSDAVVFNSPFTYELYKNDITNKNIHIIPLGVNFDLFKPAEKDYTLNILPNSILFIGANNPYPKGFDMMMEIINKTNYNFCLVMKDDFTINHPRVKVFNNVSHSVLVKIINNCSLLICTSRMETLHLSGIEAAACNLPILATNVGIYHNRENGLWGQRAKKGFTNLDYMMNNLHEFSPREYFLKEGLNLESCKQKWVNLVEKT